MEGVIIKIASRCNLNCSYCYMYNKGDLSYFNQPKFMKSDTFLNLLDKVDLHINSNSLDSFQFIFHGGEPLLLGPKKMEWMLKEIYFRFHQNLKLIIAVQTNGILLSKEYCQIFNKYNVLISISLDGDKEANDLNRLDFSNKSSFFDTLAGISLGQLELKIPPAILSVIQVNESPEKVYQFFKSLNISDWDVLLPDHNHESIRLNNRKESISNWLIRLFDLWYSDKHPKPRIRRFLNIIYLILGKKVNSDTLGLELNNLLVIETNGDIEPIDVLKIEGHNFTKTNIDVFNNNFNEAFNNPLIKLYKESNRKVTKLCKKCIIYPICGGGYLPHRFSNNNKFNNRTVYCHDLMKLITHIQNRILDDLKPSTLKEAGIKKFTFQEVYDSVYN